LENLSTENTNFKKLVHTIYFLTDCKTDVPQVSSKYGRRLTVNLYKLYKQQRPIAIYLYSLSAFVRPA